MLKQFLYTGVFGTLVVAKWLDQRSSNIEGPSSNPPGARAINDRVSLIRSLKRGVSLLLFLR